MAVPGGRFVAVNPNAPAWWRLAGVSGDPLVPARAASVVFWAAVAVSIGVAWAASGSDSDPGSASGQAAGWVAVVGVGGAWLVTRYARRHCCAFAPLPGPATAGPAAQLERVRAEAIRFRRAAATDPRNAELLRTTLSAVQVSLWQGMLRLVQIAPLDRELTAMGARSTGPAKDAYRAELTDRIAALARPIGEALREVGRLADAAEEVRYARALARDLPEPDVPGAPTGAEVLASRDIEAATRQLRVWADTWIELDTRLRAAARKLGTADGDGRSPGDVP